MQPDDPGPRKFGDNHVRDSRLSKIILWIAGIASVITATGCIAFVSKFFQMSDSQVRIEGKIDAANQIQGLQFNQIDQRMRGLENRVGAIEQRQIDAQNSRARP